MAAAQALLFGAAVVLLTLAGMGVTARRVSLPLLAYACALAGLALPVFVAATC